MIPCSIHEIQAPKQYQYDVVVDTVAALLEIGVCPMKTIEFYLNQYRGVRQVQSDLKNNGNKLAVFDVNLLTAFRVIVESVTSNVVKDIVKLDLSQLSDRQITILEFMIQNPAITAKEMSQRLSLTSRTVQRDIANLTKLGMIIREGGRYDGLWKVIATKK